MQHADDFIGCNRDEHAVEPETCSAPLHVDRRLGGDPVAFLRHRRKELRERTAVMLIRRANLDAIAVHPCIFRDVVHTLAP
jgi:hypothetical protein